MAFLDSLPPRPLDDGEVASLNRSESVSLAVAVDDDGPTDAVLLATDSWVKGLLFADEGWSVVETVTLDDETERYEGLRVCEETVRAVRDGDADAGDNSDGDADADDNPDDDTDTDADDN
ncbi:hypothetical protein SAMN04487949_2399 [Halogranum gelatinilyticum]|uniref:DUF7964 domain-containing protein n=1 Tax=Halogranum gelatinilyticum TaxID=660521 RepID=A0A1G9VJA4_9EURY|nr:hypothetical protein [Halogranum gelatinilyticum]SDM72163.1 hypothetical protein SAMN04487949_2399 [Halogranum gelatinilyticum]